jgi:polar amino acid transport system substrate-binding protein
VEQVLRFSFVRERMTMKGILFAVIGLVLAGPLAGGAHAEDTVAQVQKRGVLVVGVKYRVPPFGFFDPQTGGLDGYDVDVAKALASKLGVQLELKPVDQKTRIPTLIDGHADIVAANVTANRDIGKVIAFSDVYLTTGVGFIAKRGMVRRLQDLQGRKIAVAAGTVAEETITRDVPGVVPVVFNDYRIALEALQSGAVAAGAGDSSILPALLPLLPKGEFEVLPFQTAEIPYVIGMRRGERELQDFVNQVVREMQQSGELKRLYAKWFQAETEAADEGPVASAAGVISRKASTRPRYLAVILRGDFIEDEAVSVFSTNGEFVSTGTVGAVFADQVYVDVDPEKYDRVKPGFAVGMDVKQAKAKDAIMEHQDILIAVREESEKEAEALAAEIEAEGKAKEQRQIEEDRLDYQNDLRIRAERAADRDNNRYYYSGRHNRARDRRYYR